METEAFVKIQRALAEPKRLEILETIRRLDVSGGSPCSAVLSEMTIAQSTLSHHISELAAAGLIVEQKQGKFSLLSVNEAVVEAYLTELRKRILDP